jgi:hypothetical protein
MSQYSTRILDNLAVYYNAAAVRELLYCLLMPMSAAPAVEALIAIHLLCSTA